MISFNDDTDNFGKISYRDSHVTLIRGIGFYEGRMLTYGGPQVHSEFQMTLLIFKHTPDSKSSLLILKAHS